MPKKSKPGPPPEMERRIRQAAGEFIDAVASDPHLVQMVKFFEAEEKRKASENDLQRQELERLKDDERRLTQKLDEVRSRIAEASDNQNLE